MNVVLIGACWSGAEARPDEQQVMAETLDRLVARNKGHGGGIVRVALPGQVLAQSASGLMAGPGSAAMTPDTPFEIASTTKAVTAATIMRLVEDGRLSLDNTLPQVLPAAEAKGFDPRITIRQLLSHTSGLQHYWEDGKLDRDGNNAFLRAFLSNPDHFWTSGEILDQARAIPAKKPGSRFHYSDTNYVLLGRIIENTTGKPLHRVFREMIFNPLGMNSTWLTYRESRRGAPQSHRYEGDEDLTDVPRQSADWAGGGLVSTAKDLEKFLRGLASGKLFKKADTLSQMKTYVPVGEEGISYGLGLYRVELDGGKGEIWGHDGHGNSFAYYWPQKDITFTGTLNQVDSDWWPLIDAYLDDEVPVAEIEDIDRSWEAALSVGWDSLYMDRGVNGLRDTGYGSSILWTDLNVVWALSEVDFITFDVWQAFATQFFNYKEVDFTIDYTRYFGDFSVSLDYQFSYGYGSGDYFSHELGVTLAYDWQIGSSTITPSIGYYYNLGPDGEDRNGFARAGSSFLAFRLDGHTPVYRDIVSLEPWAAFGVNFRYNSKVGAEDEPEAFNGANNVEFGLAVPFRLSRIVTVAGYAAYSHALTDLYGTERDTFWGGVSVTLSY